MLLQLDGTRICAFAQIESLRDSVLLRKTRAPPTGEKVEVCGLYSLVGNSFR